MFSIKYFEKWWYYRFTILSFRFLSWVHVQVASAHIALFPYPRRYSPSISTMRHSALDPISYYESKITQRKNIAEEKSTAIEVIVNYSCCLSCFHSYYYWLSVIRSMMLLLLSLMHVVEMMLHEQSLMRVSSYRESNESRWVIYWGEWLPWWDRGSYSRNNQFLPCTRWVRNAFLVLLRPFASTINSYSFRTAIVSLTQHRSDFQRRHSWNSSYYCYYYYSAFVSVSNLVVAFIITWT